MKKTSKALSLLLALLVVLSLGVTAFADFSGSITVKYTMDSITTDVTYNAYLILKRGTDSADNTIYYLTSDDSKLQAFLESNAVGLTFASATLSDGTGVNAVQMSGSDFVTSSGTIDAENLTNLLKTNASSLKNAVGNYSGITSGPDKQSDGTYQVSITSLTTEGYYYVDSKAGAVVSVDSSINDDGTSNEAKEIDEKDLVPTIVKSVSTSATGNYYTDLSVDVCDKLYYKLVVNNGNVTSDVTDNFVIEDTFPAGLTLDTDSVNIDVANWTKDTDYKIDTSTDGKLIITLYKDSLKTLDSYTDITIAYSASLVDSTSKFVNTGVDYTWDGNTNAATLTINGETIPTEATVRTYEIGHDEDGNATFTKINGSTKALLAGAVFQLTNTDGKTATFNNKGELTGWVDYSNITDEDTQKSCNITTDDKGEITVKGLAAGTYILTETQAPKGYNKLTSTITVKIEEDRDNSTVNITYQKTGDTTGSPQNSITVKNNKGGTMPSTGGIGTTVFYVVGGLMVAAALILLITKKRMSGYQD